MSDPPAPRPQPPPPPPLTPPPGYVGYAETNWRGDLVRVRGLERWIAILLGVSALSGILGLATTSSAFNAAEDFVQNRTNEDEFRDAITANSLSGLLGGAASIALLVLSVIWLYRVIRNHRTLGREVTWGPGWAIAGWVLPPILFVIPLLVLRESWKASDPDVPPTSPAWRQNRDHPAIWFWFVVYGVLPLVFTVLTMVQVGQFMVGSGTQISGSVDDLAEYLNDSKGLIIAQGLVSIVAALAWFLVVRVISERHARLTGEAAAR